MAKISLININEAVPPTAPYALDILATSATQKGHDTEVLDLTPSENHEKRLLVIDEYFGHSNPDFVGVTQRNSHQLILAALLTDQAGKGSFLPGQRELIDRIKEYIPVDRILMGGAAFSSNPHALLRYFGLRYGVQGSGESLLPLLAERYDRHKKFSDSEVEIFDGREGCDSPLPVPVQRRFVDNAWYYDNGGLSAVRTSNGCPNRCSYCVEPYAKGNKLSTFSPAAIVDEVRQLVNLGIHDIHTGDSEFNLRLEHAKAVLRALKEAKLPTDLRFWTFCQTTPFDPELAQLLAEAGFKGILFSTDHTDSGVLRSMEKSYNWNDIVRTTKLCHQFGIAVGHVLLFGHPGDTPEKMFKAIREIEDLNSRTVMMTLGLSLEPNTQLRRKYLEGLLQGNVFPRNGRVNDIDPIYFVADAFGEDPAQVLDDMARLVPPKDAVRTLVPKVRTSGDEGGKGTACYKGALGVSEKPRGAYWYNYPDRSR